MSTTTTRPVPHPFIPGIHSDTGTIQQEGAAPLTRVMPQTTVTIASVVPWALESKVYEQLRGRPVFRLAEWKKGAPARLLRVKHSSSLLMDVFNPDPGTKPGEVEVPRYAVEPNDPTKGYAIDLINEWAGGRPANEGGRIGVGIILGKKPWQDDNEPTEQEVNALHKLQQAFFRSIVAKADAAYLSQDPRRKSQVHWGESNRGLWFLHDLYGEPLYHTDGSLRHAWYQQGTLSNESEALVNCPRCMKLFPKLASMCHNCQTDLATHMLDRGMPVDSSKYPGIAQEITWRKQKKSA